MADIAAMMADEQIATALATNIGNTNKAVVRDAASLAFSYLPFGQRSSVEAEDAAPEASASGGPPPPIGKVSSTNHTVIMP